MATSFSVQDCTVPGAVVVLLGPSGSGKTHKLRAAAAALGGACKPVWVTAPLLHLACPDEPIKALRAIINKVFSDGAAPSAAAGCTTVLIFDDAQDLLPPAGLGGGDGRGSTSRGPDSGKGGKNKSALEHFVDSNHSEASLEARDTAREVVALLRRARAAAAASTAAGSAADTDATTPGAPRIAVWLAVRCSATAAPSSLGSYIHEAIAVEALRSDGTCAPPARLLRLPALRLGLDKELQAVLNQGYSEPCTAPLFTGGETLAAVVASAAEAALRSSSSLRAAVTSNTTGTKAAAFIQRLARQAGAALASMPACAGYVAGDAARVVRLATALLAQAAPLSTATSPAVNELEDATAAAWAASLTRAVDCHVPSVFISDEADPASPAPLASAATPEASTSVAAPGVPALRAVLALPGFAELADYTPTRVTHRGWAGAAGPSGRPANEEDADEDAPARGGGGTPARRGGTAAALAAALRPAVADIPWEAVVGQSAAKAALYDALLFPLEHPGVMARLGLPPPAGVLLYGPPGTGKTLLAKAVASRMRGRFLYLPIPAILRSGVGDSERALSAAFGVAMAAAPCVVFVDELQALFVARGGGGGDDGEASRMAAMLTTTLLQCFDRLRGFQAAAAAGEPSRLVVVMGATNVPEAVDPALLRPGRFDRQVYVGLPTEEERAELFASLLGKAFAPRGCSERALAAAAAAAAAACPGFTGADVTNVVRLALRTFLMAARSGVAGAPDEALASALHAAMDEASASTNMEREAALRRWTRTKG